MRTLKRILIEHKQYFKQIISLTKIDLIKTYRGAALGWIWALIKPILTILVYWFAVSVGLRISGDVSGYPYFLWLLAGIIPWFYMGEMLTKGANCLKKNSYLVTKMKFPISVIPTFTNLSRLFVNLMLLILGMLIFILMGYTPTIYWLQLPFYILIMFVFMNAWSYFAAFLTAISRDFYNLIKSLVTPIFWLSAIIWNVDTIDIPWLKNILNLNPITYIVEGYRNCLIEQKWFFENIYSTIAFFGILIIISILGLYNYKKLRKEIPDVI